MRHINQSIYRKLLATLAWLLIAAPGAWAQRGAALPALRTLADPAQPAKSVLISNRIQFHGQVPDTQTNYRADPLDVCPNVVDPNNPSIISGQPYQFQFESNCDGKIWLYTDPCNAKPNFIWTIKYFTEGGGEYQEKRQDMTYGDFSKIRLYLYDRVPYPSGGSLAPTPTNGQATQAGGNTNFSAMPYPNLYCLNAPVNAVQPGDVITSVRLECTGYSCGWSGGQDNDGINIRYYGRRPENISLGSVPLPLCRTQSYTVSTNAVLGASGYNWTASNGATIVGAGGNNTTATLTLNNVPANVTNISLRVAALDYNNCGGTTGAPRFSTNRTITVPIRQAPAQPANMQIDGACPSTTAKTLTVNTVSLPLGEPANTQIIYQWSINTGANSANSQLIGSNNPNIVSTNVPYVQITTPNTGSVTVNVEAKASDCGGPGLLLTRAFQIGNITPVCPTATFTYDYCGAGTALVLQGQPGLSYYITRQPYNISVSGGTATVSNGISPTSTSFPASANFSKGTFDIDFLVTSPCPPAGSPGYVSCTLTVYVPKLPTFYPCRPAGQAPQEEPESVVHLYPNPATALVIVQPEVPTRYQWVKVMNLQGRVVLNQKAAADKSITSFDVRDLPAGLYEVQLFDGQKRTTQRLQKD